MRKGSDYIHKRCKYIVFLQNLPPKAQNGLGKEWEKAVNISGCTLMKEHIYNSPSKIENDLGRDWGNAVIISTSNTQTECITLQLTA